MRRILIILLVLSYNTSFTQIEYPDSLNKKKLYTAIGIESGFYVAGMSYLQFIWYKDHERVPFHVYDDSKGYLQIDKFGHAYGAYMESYVGYHWLRKAGVNKKKALIYGSSLGFLLQTPIEIFDGIYEGWGFSWSDMVANAAGAAMITSQALLFDEQNIRYKYSFSVSEDYHTANKYLGESKLASLFEDYNSHTYWLSTSINHLGIKKSKLSQIIGISLGYSAEGMLGEFKNRTWYRGQFLDERRRNRQFLLSLDIDWVKIPTSSKLLKSIFEGLNFVKLPFPAVEYNSNGKFKGYGLYF